MLRMYVYNNAATNSVNRYNFENFWEVIKYKFVRI